MTAPTSRLRRQLTLWYALTLGTIVLALGGALFAVIRGQIADQLDDSLQSAVHAVERAAAIREQEHASVEGPVVDAVAELRVQDRVLYLLDHRATPVVPPAASAGVRAAARRALRDSLINVSEGVPGDRSLRLVAERFRTPSGRVYVAAAEADQVEVEDRYAALILAFGGAALAALVLFAAVGWFLTDISVRPVTRSMESMRRFVADAAHELRTPLAVIRSRAEVALARTAADTEQGVGARPADDRDALAAIVREAARLGGIVENLLLLARSDAGAWPVASEPAYLDDILSDAVSAARELASRRGVVLEVAEFDETPVTGDPALLHRLALILLDNAIKFTPAGGRVRAAAIRSDGRAVLRVSDTGVGITAEQQPHVFERFYRADAARGRANGADGAGLGLSIAEWITVQHRGEIALESAPGEGTTVIVRLPLRREPSPT